MLTCLILRKAVQSNRYSCKRNRDVMPAVVIASIRILLTKPQERRRRRIETRQRPAGYSCVATVAPCLYRSRGRPESGCRRGGVRREVTSRTGSAPCGQPEPIERRPIATGVTISRRQTLDGVKLAYERLHQRRIGPLNGLCLCLVARCR